MEMLVNESHLEHTDVEVGKESAPSPLTEFRERLVSRPASRRRTTGFQAGTEKLKQRGSESFLKASRAKERESKRGGQKTLGHSSCSIFPEKLGGGREKDCSSFSRLFAPGEMTRGVCAVSQWRKWGKEESVPMK